MENNTKSNILEQVFLLRETYDEHFVVKLIPQLEVILGMRSDKTKLDILLKFRTDANKLFDEYQLNYQKLYWQLKEAFKENETIDWDEIYLLFFDHEELYRFTLGKIENATNKVQAEAEIKRKYLKQSTDKTISAFKLPVDINLEFKKLFINDKVAVAFINLLKVNEYISADDKWKGVSNNPGELREAYLVLKSMDLLCPGKKPIPSLQIFYKRFGLRPEEPGVKDYYISLKSLGSTKTTKDNDLFRELLRPLARLSNKSV